MIDPDEISSLKVYPPLGIARVGNAPGPEDYVFAPEVIGGPPTLSGSLDDQPARFVDDFRAIDGALKRQAARFRVYAHLKDGNIVEVTAAMATIEWTVAVANLKAGWYDFEQAMDLPKGPIKDANRRNADLIGTMRRSRLNIVPAPKSVSGLNALPVRFDDGQFWSRNVYLGEIRTDDAGRLIVLGGMGTSTAFRPHLSPLTFANNVGWHDDVSDGPVRAMVTFARAGSMVAEPGYVVVAPPNFAPDLYGVVTMDDTVREVFHDRGWLQRPSVTSFSQDVLPIFQRLTDHQWINHGLFVLHGFGSPLDARDPTVAARMNDASASNAAWRGRVFRLFADPDPNAPFRFQSLPQNYGDGLDTWGPGAEKDPSKISQGLLTVVRTQYEHLNRWRAGQFTPDWTGRATAVPSFSTLTAGEQIRHLERAPLHACLGGPFHPAIELTWVMRIPSVWKEPYRLNVLGTNEPARQDFGDVLTPAICLAAGGPYDGVAAGALTRFLGLPWQTDHTSCNSDSDYQPSTYLSMPTFWGTRAPDQVLSEGDYKRFAALASVGLAGSLQAQKHAMNRVDWLRDLRGFDYYSRIASMVTKWSELGMILPIPGAPPGIGEPRVEQGRNGNQSGAGRIDVAADPKFGLLESVEGLVGPESALPTAELDAVPKPAETYPGKPTYRRGEI